MGSPREMMTAEVVAGAEVVAAVDAVAGVEAVAAVEAVAIVEAVATVDSVVGVEGVKANDTVPAVAIATGPDRAHGRQTEANSQGENREGLKGLHDVFSSI